MRRWISLLFLMAACIFVPAAWSNTYTTSFSLTECPISEGSNWVNGGTTGLDWTNICTLAATKAYGTSSGVAPGYDDSTAVLQGYGTWNQNQSATGIVYLGTVVSADDPEVEIRLNTTIAAHSITGYECNYSAHTSSPYASIVRWNGASGNFTQLSTTTSVPVLANGDTLTCTNIGGTITEYHNGTVINTATDSTYTAGAPGIGTDLDNGGSSSNGTFGFSNFTATDGAATHVSSTSIDDTLTGWDPVCVIGSCSGGSPGGIDTPASTSQTINNATPSLDGESMFIGETTNTTSTETNALWAYNAPNTCDTCINVTADFQTYIGSNGAHAQAFEYDSFIFDTTHSQDFLAGTQCDQSTGYWEIANQISAWTHTPLVCSLSYSAWHHIVENFHRDPPASTACSGVPCEHFDSIAIDGKINALNQTLPVTALPADYRADVGTQFQIDIGPTTSAQTVTENLDESSITAGPASCPTGATYGPANNLTLASIGIDICYYMAASGSDSNDGLTESTPLAHFPNTPNCASNCATLQTTCNAGSGLACAGYGFIFRGGDTWHFGASTAPSTGGTALWNTGAMGTAGHPIYFGVDQTWYTGGSWVRPIWTGDNPVCGPSNVGGSCHSGSISSYTVPQYYVSSCATQIGANNIMIITSGSSHFILDNIEMTGLCQNAVGQPSNHDEYIAYGSSADMGFYNLYIHGWTHVIYADVNGGGGCTGSNVCFGISIFAGGGSTTPDDVHRYEVIDGSDSDPIAAQACYCDFNDVAYSYIGNQSGVITRYQHSYHDNLYEWWYENGHGNVIESVGDQPTTNVMYNNITRHINTTADPGDPGFWPYPQPGHTNYFFNNLNYDWLNMEYFNIGQNAPETSGQGPLIVFNNTFQYNTPYSGIFGCSSPYAFTWTARNNHYISAAGTIAGLYTAAPACTSGGNSDTNGLLMTNATATTDGYTSSQTYAYSPTSGGSPTVGIGANETSTFCAALTSAGLTDAAAACTLQTTYACAYNSSTHRVSCPVISSPTARPVSGAWDVGAYEYGGSPPPLPPSGITAVGIGFTSF